MMSAGTSDKQRVLKRQRNVRLAQLDRAFGYGPKGRGFESSNARISLISSDIRDFFVVWNVPQELHLMRQPLSYFL